MTAIRRPSLLAVTNEVSVRGMRRLVRRPSLFIPAVVMPLFFVVTFTGSFSSIADAPGFPADDAWDWMTIYAILQGASFAGVGTAGMTAEDIENGFFDRMLLAPGRRVSLLLGALSSAIQRAFIPTVVVLALALSIGEASMPGGFVGVALIFLAAAGAATMFGLFGMITVYIGRTQRSLLAVQVIIFSGLFLSTGQVPIDFQTGWLHTASRINPVTNILQLGRQGFLGEVTWADTWPGLVAIAVPAVLLGALAHRLLLRFAQ